MKYNKTKRGLELASAILGLIGSSLVLLAGLAGVFVSIVYAGTMLFLPVLLPILCGSVVFLGLSIPGMIFSIKCLKSPLKADGTLRRGKASRICLLVFTILMGCFISAGLMIAVLCLKDFKQPKQKVNSMCQLCINQEELNRAVRVYDDVNELKRFKKLGIVDETAFKRGIAKIVTEVINDK